MADVSESGIAHRPKPVLSLVALALVLAAWGAFCLGQYRANLLGLSRFGRCEGICEALARDIYVSRLQLPYVTAALLLDGLAPFALIAAGAAGQFRVLSVLAVVLWLPSGAWHGLGYFVSMMFASNMVFAL